MAKILQVSIDAFYVYKSDKFHSPAIFIGDACVHRESCGKFVKNCRSLEEAMMIIDLNGWEYVEQYPPIEMSKSEYRQKYRKDGKIGYSDIDRILIDNGYEKWYT